uniref:Uncharacterized protein n=1 Tax=Avena sativa TaxID=4498 RepID=A0ACD5ZR10_AVESA
MALAPHLVFVPSAGMGHLLPFSRFITALANTGAVDISVVTALPTVSAAEAEHFDGLFAAFPAIRRIDFNLLPFDESVFAGADPFHLQWESLRRSAHLLGPMIASATPRASAVITDVTLASQVIPIAKDELHLPCHVLFVSCATMLSFLAYFPTYLNGAEADHLAADVDVPGIGLIPVDYPPAVLRNPDSLFTKQFIANGRLIAEADGILVNTFDALEPDALAALRSGKVVPGFPPVFAVGPLMSSTTGSDKGVGRTSSPIAWLDAQPARSVVYVAFGNRNAAVPDQIRQIGAGLEASGCRFLVASVKSPAFVNTPRYSEVSLAGARGFFLSLLERFSTLNLCLLAVFFVFVLRYLLVAIVTKTTVVDREDNAELKDFFNASGFPLPGRIPDWFVHGLPSSLAVRWFVAGVDGELPLDLGTSGNLTTLILASNSLSGRIPASVFASKALRFLDLSNNNLTGELIVVSVSAGDGAGVLFNASGISLYGTIGRCV